MKQKKILSNFLNKGLITCYTGLIINLYSCNGRHMENNKTKVLYGAIHQTDTAKLNIQLNDKEFYGQFEINYNGVFKDSGDVSGIVKKDTLLGTYHFQHYGIQEWHRIPIALLKKNKQLIMGEGNMEIYMNITFFTKNIPIDYQHPKFIFEELH